MNKNDEKILFTAVSAHLNSEELLLATLQGMIAAEISMRRQELELSQKEFSEKMHVSQGLVSRWENGDTNFTLQTLVKISSVLGLKMQSPIVPRIPKKYSYKSTNIVPFNGGSWNNCSLKQKTTNNFKTYDSDELEEM